MNNNQQTEMSNVRSAVFDALPEQMDAANEFLFANPGYQKLAEHDRTRLSVSYEELFVNIASYASPDTKGKVTVDLFEGQDEFFVRFTDSGIPFDPLNHEDPDISLGFEERPIGGLGIMLVRKYSSSVYYERTDDGCNVLTIGMKKPEQA